MLTGLVLVFVCVVDAVEWNSNAIQAERRIRPSLDTDSSQEESFSTIFPLPDEELYNDVNINETEELESRATAIAEELTTTEFESTASFPPTEPPHICDEGRICVRKCCPLGTLLNFERGCTDVTIYNATDWEPNFDTLDKDKIEIVTQPLKQRKGLVCAVHKANEFVLQDDGNVYYKEGGKTLSYDYYCIDNKFENGKVSLFGSLCIEEVIKSNFNKVADKIQLGFSGISAFFILLILVLHGFSSTEKELQTKLVLSSCISLFFGQISIIVNNFPSFLITLKNDYCVALAISIQFFLLSFLFWLNIMCYEISRIIRGTVKFKTYKELTKSERRFFFYGLFAWGIPMIVCIVTICMQYLPDELPSAIEPYIIRPHIAKGRCWFRERGYSIYVYYYGIEMTIHIANTFLMGHTAYLLYKDSWTKLCLCSNNPPTRLRSHTSTNYLKMFKQRLRIYILYVFIWMMNIFTLINPYKEYWRFVDFIVALQGLFLFCIVVNPKKHPILMNAYEKVTNAAKSYSFKISGKKVEAVDPIAVTSITYDSESSL